MAYYHSTITGKEYNDAFTAINTHGDHSGPIMRKPFRGIAMEFTNDKALYIRPDSSTAFASRGGSAAR